MLMSIMGETVPSKGLQVDGHIAYAAQEAFIFPSTIRENILCGRPFDENLYSRVLSACALSYDLRQLPNGDQTELGDKGLTLSGGQRQRIVGFEDGELGNLLTYFKGLARAVYSQATLTLLDDPFSALDAETEAHGDHPFFSLFIEHIKLIC